MITETVPSFETLLPGKNSADHRQLRRVWWIWALLFLNVLGYSKGQILPMPHRVGQLLTQGALALALVLALTINPKVIIRPNVFLGLYSILAITSLAMSIRFIGIGTDYRAIRLVIFLAVLWLLTPWWGRPDLILLRCQVRFLVLILVTTLLGIPISPHAAFAVNYGSHRLTDAIWPIVATQVGHYVAELAGLAAILWMSGLVARKRALFLLVPSCAALLATHTRTAIAGLLVGLFVAALSLFTVRRRVRRTFVTVLIVVVAVVVPLSPILSSWLVRGQTGSELSNLSGRTKVWPTVLSEPKPETNKILGSGLSNGSVVGALQPASDGLPIDGGWVATYQDQGYVGWVLEGAMFLVLLVTGLLARPGPSRAFALFLIVYCLFASFTETGLGEASSYLLDLTLAASLLVPARRVMAGTGSAV
jgi:hypothetical protein